MNKEENKEKVQTRNLICIQCPMGCLLTVVLSGGEVQSVAGNTCRRGEVYARAEVTAPVRTVTTSVAVENGSMPAVSVKTASPISREKIFDCVRALTGITAEAPIRIGDVILSNVAGTGTDIVATRNVSLKIKRTITG